MRPEALEAATTPDACESVHSSQQQVQHLNNSKPPVASTDGTSPTTDNAAEKPTSAATLVSKVVQTVKTAVDDTMTWAEKKVDNLNPGQESSGPYTSPATCMPSDLDVIASGLMPAMQSIGQDSTKNDSTNEKDEQNKQRTKQGNEKWDEV